MTVNTSCGLRGPQLPWPCPGVLTGTASQSTWEWWSSIPLLRVFSAFVSKLLCDQIVWDMGFSQLQDGLMLTNRESRHDRKIIREKRKQKRQGGRKSVNGNGNKKCSAVTKPKTWILFFLALNFDGFTGSLAISKRKEKEECAWRHMKGNWKQFPKCTLFFKIDQETAEIWWVKVATIDIS